MNIEVDEEKPQQVPNEATKLVQHGSSKDDSENNQNQASFKSWIRLLVFFIASCISAGILPGQNEYNRLFCEAGLFRYACGEDMATNFSGESNCCQAQWLLIANVMNVLSISIYFLFFICGLLFDMLGGQKCAIIGCSLLIGGFLLIAGLIQILSTSIEISPSMETLIFVVAVLLCDCGAMAVNVAFYSFIYHFPKSQAFVLSLSNACLSCGSFLPLLVAWFISFSDLDLASTLLLYCVLLSLAAILSWVTVPSVEEYRHQALEILGLPIPLRAIKGWKGAIKKLKEARTVIAHDEKFHRIAMATSVVAWLPAFFYMSLAEPLGKQIFGNEHDGQQEGVLYLKINSVCGILVGPALAIFVDSFDNPSQGLTELMVVLSVFLTVVGFFCKVPSWIVQTIVLSCSTAGQAVVLLFLTRHAIVFSFPQRVGSVTGSLVAFMGILTLPLILISTFTVMITGSYVWPAVVTSFCGAIGTGAFAAYSRRFKPYPYIPVLLPEDEKDISKQFSVSTIEDAAFVANMSKDELLRLSASRKVADQRRLSDIALSADSNFRLLTIARRRSSLMSVKPKYTSMDYAVPNFAVDKVRKGTMETSADCVATAFNGHGHFGGRNEPAFDWILSPIGPPDEPRRVETVTSLIRPMLAVAEAYGIILEVKDVDEHGETVTAATCAVYPPGDLESDGSYMKVGGHRWFYGLAASKSPPTFLNKDVVGRKMIQRSCIKLDSQWNDRRRDYPRKFFYVGILGVHPVFQGRRYGSLLLDIVASYAEAQKADCYLECSEPNVEFYEKNGYTVWWSMSISADVKCPYKVFGMHKVYKE